MKKYDAGVALGSWLKQLRRSHLPPRLAMESLWMGRDLVPASQLPSEIGQMSECEDVCACESVFFVCLKNPHIDH